MDDGWLHGGKLAAKECKEHKDFVSSQSKSRAKAAKVAKEFSPSPPSRDTFVRIFLRLFSVCFVYFVVQQNAHGRKFKDRKAGSTAALVVRPNRPRPAVAAHARSLCRLGFGNHHLTNNMTGEVIALILQGVYEFWEAQK
jgi:hypothetical protein